MKFQKLGLFLAFTSICIISVISTNISAANQPDHIKFFFRTLADKFMTGPEDRLVDQKLQAYAIMLRLDDKGKRSLSNSVDILRSSYQRALQSKSTNPLLNVDEQLQTTIDSTFEVFFSGLPKEQASLINSIAIEAAKSTSIDNLKRFAEGAPKQ